MGSKMKTEGTVVTLTHPLQSPVTCDLCSNRFGVGEVKNLRKSIKRHHLEHHQIEVSDFRNFCSICKIDFPNPVNQRDRHRCFSDISSSTAATPASPESTEFVCETCARAFPSVKSLNQHIRLSHEDAPAPPPPATPTSQVTGANGTPVTPWGPLTRRASSSLVQLASTPQQPTTSRAASLAASSSRAASIPQINLEDDSEDDDDDDFRAPPPRRARTSNPSTETGASTSASSTHNNNEDARQPVLDENTVTFFHPPPQLYRCPLCSKTYKWSRNWRDGCQTLRRHLADTHRVKDLVTVHKCFQCEQVLHDKPALHQCRTNSNPQGTLRCLICDTELTSITGLRNHMRMHQKRGDPLPNPAGPSRSPDPVVNNHLSSGHTPQNQDNSSPTRSPRSQTDPSSLVNVPSNFQVPTSTATLRSPVVFDAETRLQANSPNSRSTRRISSNSGPTDTNEGSNNSVRAPESTSATFERGSPPSLEVTLEGPPEVIHGDRPEDNPSPGHQDEVGVGDTNNSRPPASPSSSNQRSYKKNSAPTTTDPLNQVRNDSVTSPLIDLAGKSFENPLGNATTSLDPKFGADRDTTSKVSPLIPVQGRKNKTLTLSRSDSQPPQRTSNIAISSNFSPHEPQSLLNMPGEFGEDRSSGSPASSPVTAMDTGISEKSTKNSRSRSRSSYITEATTTNDGSKDSECARGGDKTIRSRSPFPSLEVTEVGPPEVIIEGHDERSPTPNQRNKIRAPVTMTMRPSTSALASKHKNNDNKSAPTTTDPLNQVRNDITTSPLIDLAGKSLENPLGNATMSLDPEFGADRGSNTEVNPLRVVQGQKNATLPLSQSDSQPPQRTPNIAISPISSPHEPPSLLNVPGESGEDRSSRSPVRSPVTTRETEIPENSTNNSRSRDRNSFNTESTTTNGGSNDSLGPARADMTNNSAIGRQLPVAAPERPPPAVPSTSSRANTRAPPRVRLGRVQRQHPPSPPAALPSPEVIGGALPGSPVTLPPEFEEEAAISQHTPYRVPRRPRRPWLTTQEDPAIEVVASPQPRSLNNVPIPAELQLIDSPEDNGEETTRPYRWIDTYDNEDKSYLHKNFWQPLTSLLRSDQSEENWNSFANLLNDMTAGIQKHLKIKINNYSTTVTRAVDPTDPQTIQRLYKRNRRRAVRLICSGESKPCQIPPERLETFYTDKRAVKQMDPTFYSQAEDDNPVNMDPFSPDEVAKKLQSFENTAPGEDKLTYRHWKSLDPNGAALAVIFNICLKYRKIPSEWKESSTILIYKKGDENDPANWRPIAVLRTIYKLYSGLITARLTDWVIKNNKLSAAQKGFMPFDGVFEHNFVLQRYMKDARTHKGDLYVAWLDFRDAFGSIPHAAPVAALQHYGAGPIIRQVVADLYLGCSTTFVTGSGRTNPVPLQSGVHQGDPLSGVLFNLCINPILERANANSTPQRHGVLAFADDLTPIASNPQMLQWRIDTIVREGARISIHPNAEKCLSMHLTGIPPVGTRPTTFRVQGVTIKALKDNESARFLGKRVGYLNLGAHSTVQDFIDAGLKITRSALSPWQKLDAMKTFFYSTLVFHMRMAALNKTEWERIDEVLRPELKTILSLPSSAANAYLYGSSEGGCCSIPICAEDSDIFLVDNAFKLLTSPDSVIRRSAADDLEEVVRQKLGRKPTTDEKMLYLSGSAEGDLSRRRGTIKNVWSQARGASKRLNIRWDFDDDTGFTVKVINDEEDRERPLTEIAINSEKRREVAKSIRNHRRDKRVEELKEMQSQGKTFETIGLDKSSSYFINNGSEFRFADWRFIHRARLNRLPLYAATPWADRDSNCRRCQMAPESVGHVLGGCFYLHHEAYTRRHDELVEHIKRAAHGKFEILGENTTQDETRLRPDLVLRKGRDVYIVDVAVCHEKSFDNLKDMAREKKNKYAAMAASLQQRYSYRKVEVHPFIMGSLGSWFPPNDRFMSVLCSKSYGKTMRRRCVADTIKWGRDIYIEHVTGKRQYPP